jgi:hypothetical protein
MRYLTAPLLLLCWNCGGSTDLFTGGVGGAPGGQGGASAGGSTAGPLDGSAGAPVAATGGRTASGGRAPEGASGGMPSGGAPPGGSAAGGSGGADAAAGSGSPGLDAGAGSGGQTDAPPLSVFRCGTELTCTSMDEACCLVYSVQSGTTTYSCLASGESTTHCNSAVRTCDGASDCPGQVCCAQWRTVTSRYANFTCEGACASPNLVVECRGSADCPAGELCCGDLTASSTRYTSLTCGATCDEDIICDSSADCPDDYDCVQSSILPPGFGYCVAN